MFIQNCKKRLAIGVHLLGTPSLCHSIQIASSFNPAPRQPTLIVILQVVASHSYFLVVVVIL